MSIGSGVLLPGVVEIPTFPILRPLAYTTGLGYRPTCDTCTVEEEDWFSAIVATVIVINWLRRRRRRRPRHEY